MRTKLLTYTTAFLLTIGIVAIPLPAQAVSQFDICNSSGSVENIAVSYNGVTKTWLEPGRCLINAPTAGTRVDVDTQYGVDVDSYRIKSGDADNGPFTWGPCHETETNTSDPPNVPSIVYKNYTTGNCNGNG